MTSEFSVCSRSFVFFLAIALSALVALGQSTDEVAVRELVTRYYMAYESYDFDVQRALWSPSSIDPAAKIKNTKEKSQTIITQPKIEKLDIWRVAVDGDKATVLAKVLLTTFRKDNGKPVGGWYNREVSFRHSLVRENGEWKMFFIEFRENDLIEALKVAKSEKERETIVQEYPDLGPDYVTSALMSLAFDPEVNDYSAQLAYLQDALRQAEKTGNKENISMIYSNMAPIYTALGDHGQNLLFHLRALELEKQLGEKGNVPNELNSIGYSYSILGDHERAREYFQRSLDAPQLLPASVQRQVRVSGNLANTYLDLGDVTKAREIWTQLADLTEKNKDKADPVAPLLGLAKVARVDGKLSEAADLLTRAFAANEAMKVKVRGRDQVILRRLAEVYLALGNFDEAIRNADLALERIDRLKYADLRWEPLVYKAKANIGLGRLKEARTQLEEAIQVVEAMRERSLGGEESRQQFFRDKLAPYTTMVELLLIEGNESGAFEMAEFAKARVLLDLISGGRRPAQKLMSEAERQQESTLLGGVIKSSRERDAAAADTRTPPAKLQELEAAAAEAKRAHESFRERLYLEHPEIRVNRGEMSKASLSDAAPVLQNSRSAVLEYVASGDKVVVFAITLNATGKPEVKAFPIAIDPKALSEKVRNYRETIASGGLGFAKPSRELYDLLLKPAESRIFGKSNLIIVPDGPLWDLPFQTLQIADGKNLIENASISYVPSLTALREMRRRSKGRESNTDGDLLAFGNPIVGQETKDRMQKVFMSEKLEPLPEAERLVNELGKLYGPTRSKVFTGAEAREEIAKAESPKYRIVQFATHGILNNVSPMYSHLVFAQNDKNPNEDGLLEAWELKDLDLKADMVILTACETARGKVSNGEGIIGMTWASFIAGAPTTVASQWKVESSSTTELMLEFHRQLLAKKRVSKAEALRRAALKLMRMPMYRHPSYWAGFVLVGDGS